jgi:hypothetical protein
MLYLFFRLWKTEGFAQCFVTNEERAQDCYSRLAAVATGIERLKLWGGAGVVPRYYRRPDEDCGGVRGA